MEAKDTHCAEQGLHTFCFLSSSPDCNNLRFLSFARLLWQPFRSLWSSTLLCFPVLDLSSRGSKNPAKDYTFGEGTRFELNSRKKNKFLIDYSTLFYTFIYNPVNIHDANESGSSGTVWRSRAIWH